MCTVSDASIWCLIKSLFSFTRPGGIWQINGMRIPRVTADVATVGEARVQRLSASIISPGTTLSMQDGTAAAPGLVFANHAGAGLFYNDGVGVSVGGVERGLFTTTGALSLGGPITTPAGDLSLVPAGSNVDFNGKSIINVANLPGTNPNDYVVAMPGRLEIIGDAPTSLYLIPTELNASYLFETNIVCKNGPNSAAFMLSAMCKNVAGTVTVSNDLEFNAARDPALSAVRVYYGVAGTAAAVTAEGLPGDSTWWYGTTSVTRVLI